MPASLIGIAAKPWRRVNCRGSTGEDSRARCDGSLSAPGVRGDLAGADAVRKTQLSWPVCSEMMAYCRACDISMRWGAHRVSRGGGSSRDDCVAEIAQSGLRWCVARD